MQKQLAATQQAYQDIQSDNQCLLPNTEDEAVKIKDLSEEQPLIVFDRMRTIMAELMFLTDVVEDNQFEAHQEVLHAIIQDYSQLVELAMSRGLIMDEEMAAEQDGYLVSSPGGSSNKNKRPNAGKIANLHEVSASKHTNNEL